MKNKREQAHFPLGRGYGGFSYGAGPKSQIDIDNEAWNDARRVRPLPGQLTLEPPEPPREKRPRQLPLASH